MENIEIIKEKNNELSLLMTQRNQLVSDLANTNSSFRNTILSLLAAFVAIFTTSNLGILNNENAILITIQIVLLIIIYIEALLISGNMQRFYISAIDTYVEEKYGITCLFYQGNFNRKVTIGGGSIFPFITSATTVILLILFIWACAKYKLLQHIEKYEIYAVLTLFEISLIIGLLIYNEIDKRNGPKVYKMCLDHLKRNKTINNNLGNKENINLGE